LGQARSNKETGQCINCNEDSQVCGKDIQRTHELTAPDLYDEFISDPTSKFLLPPVSEFFQKIENFKNPVMKKIPPTIIPILATTEYTLRQTTTVKTTTPVVKTTSTSSLAKSIVIKSTIPNSVFNSHLTQDTNEEKSKIKNTTQMTPIQIISTTINDEITQNDRKFEESNS
jgi:hypothetical protein